MKKIVLIILVGMVLVGGFFTFEISVQAQMDTTYTVLAPLPCIGNDQNCQTTATQTTLEKYLPGVFKLLIGLSAVAAVLMIVICGFQYISSDAIQGKSAGRDRIKNAVLGLVLVISAWLILNTINPALMSINLSIAPIATKTPAGTLNVNNTIINLKTKDQLLTQDQASATLTSNGFTFSSTGNCTDKTKASCTSLDGIHSDTVAGLIALKTTCGTSCGNLVITGGTETGHAECYNPTTTCLPHSYGFKADVSNTQGNGAAFTSFISQQVQAQNNTPMNINGFYNISIGGFNYQVHPEGDHMDITVIPKR